MSRSMPWHGMLRSTGLILSALFFALSLTAYLVDQAVHTHAVLTWYDLNVYNDAGLITRQLPSILYTWELKPGIQFTYTPFAAVIFAGGSFLKYSALRWIMTGTGLACIPLTAWLTLGGMGRRGTGRLTAALAVSALALWIEPVVKALFLGQIEPLLMLLVVWDLTRNDDRKWKGIGIGLAAGIKLVPLIFIPYLLLAGKFRQAAVATGTFLVTVVIGFVALPKPSASYWLTGYFMRPGRTGSVHSLVNQSLLGMLARVYGTVGQALGGWLPLALAVAAGGLVGGAMLSRAGRPVQGWTLVGITSVLVSPISWDHHWVWIVPFLALLVGLAMTARPLARAGYLAAIVLIAGVMGSWPWRWSGPKAYVPRRGLLGWFVKPPEVTQLMVLHGWKLLTWNLWVVVGIVIYLALLVAAVVAWRKRPQRAVKVKAAAAPSPIDALLARADAILSGNHQLNGSGSGAAMAGKKAGEDAALDPGAPPGDPADACGEAETTASRPATAVPRPARLFPLLANSCRNAARRAWSGGPPG
ncbi:MAG TPA: glycosyltransferase 87 family protein [Streptosporangiaceae bacterium]|nr:glycosyltransferase 87 family protein [Streptosporangiaceae bacterium]